MVARAKRKPRRPPNPFTKRMRKRFLPRPFLLPIDYAEKFLKFKDDDPVPGRFSRETMPLLTSIINAWVNTDYEMIVIVGPAQSGKSLAGNHIPILYELHYRASSIGFGIPSKSLAESVFRTKLAKLFDASPELRALKKSEGGGSRGGVPAEIEFKNGAFLMIFPGGSDAAMSSKTVPKMIIDETDKRDKAGSGGEGSPIDQMINRTEAYSETRMIGKTCTVTTEAGHIWVSWEAGTRGRPHYRCPDCGEWFWFEWSFEKQLVGWDDDTDVLTCGATAFYPCPHCHHKIREHERLAMLHRPLWVHKGETIKACRASVIDKLGTFDEGVVCADGKAFRVAGKRKASKAISYWYNRLSSPMVTLGTIAQRVREAMGDDGNDEKRQAICIYQMALPWQGRIVDASELTQKLILSHMAPLDYAPLKLPVVFDSARHVLTLGIDLGGKRLHFSFDLWEFESLKRRFLTRSWRIYSTNSADGYEYPNQNHPRKIYRALAHVREIALAGFPDMNGELISPRAISVDAGYQDTVGKKRINPYDKQVYQFCRQAGTRLWHPIVGRARLDGTHVVEPREQKGRLYLWFLDNDILKTDIHDMVRIPPGELGYWHCHNVTTKYIARAMCSERRVVTFNARLEEEGSWDTIDSENHLFDASVYSWAMARRCGVQMPRPELPGE